MSNSKSEQYPAIMSEYVQHLSGIQTVITIDFAISVGLLAAYAAILSIEKNPEKMYYYKYIEMLLFLLPCIGLWTAVACIKTLFILNDSCMKLQDTLNQLEKDLDYIEYHRKSYYKPIHITIFGFIGFGIVYAVALIVTIANLNIFWDCSYIIKIIVSALVVIFIATMIWFLSENVYKWQKKVLGGKE